MIHFNRINSHVERAIAVAMYAHDGQAQWNGSPYILHPLHVMAQFEDDFHKILAVLHDAVEDSKGKVTLQMIGELFGNQVMAIIAILTHDPDVPYDDYIKDISTSQAATSIKIVDLEHNMDVRRGGKIHKKLETYIKAWKKLKEVQRLNQWK